MKEMIDRERLFLSKSSGFEVGRSSDDIRVGGLVPDQVSSMSYL